MSGSASKGVVTTHANDLLPDKEIRDKKLSQ